MRRPGASAAADGGATPPSRIGEFVLIRQLGRGGMGEVWEAEQPSMHRRVALKLLQLSALTDDDAARRFEREAWIGGRLSHPAIVKVFEQGSAPGCLYLAMELVDGGSLHARLEEERRATAAASGRDTATRREGIRRRVRAFVEVADALAHVHAHGVIHRDVKPLNLLLAADDRLRLTDFGIARESDASRLTRQGDFLGTVRYMSPEQLLAQRAAVDHRTDIWSFGVTLYEALTLRLPHDAQTDEGYVSAIAQQDPVPARRRSADIPRDLETILGKCLERDPNRRYATAAAVRDDLVRWLEDRPVLARRAGPLVRAARFARRHRMALGAAALAAAVVASAGVTIARRGDRARAVESARIALEEVVRTGVAPRGQGARWHAFEPRVSALVAKDPRGPLAILLGRANATPRVTLDRSVGLASAPPSLSVDISPLLGQHGALAHAVRVEGSLDGGPWTEIVSALHRPSPEARGEATEVGLGDVEAFGPLRAVSHRLALRANILLLPASAVAYAGLGHSRTTFHGPGLLAPLWERLTAEALWQEVRELGSLPFALYAEYPEDHPRRVPVGALTHPPSEWFDVRVIRLATELAPADGRRVLLLTLDRLDPRTKESLRVDLAPAVAPGSRVVVGLSLEGALDHSRVEASIAGRAQLRGADGVEVCSFDLVFGQLQVATASGETRVEAIPLETVGPPGPRLPSRAGRVTGLFPATDQVLPETLASPATLTIVPDVELARRHGCDPIVGEPLSFTVAIVEDTTRRPLRERLSSPQAAP